MEDAALDHAVGHFPVARDLTPRGVERMGHGGGRERFLERRGPELARDRGPRLAHDRFAAEFVEAHHDLGVVMVRNVLDAERHLQRLVLKC